MISDLFLNGGSTLSFEVSPPKTEEEFEKAYATLQKLADIRPDFFSVTYGAGGSRAKNTAEIASYIQNELHVPTLAHLTCVGSKAADILSVTAQLQEAGIDHVLALRGDRPSWMSDGQFEGRDFAHASDLTRFLKENTSLHIAGACYPEKHYEAPDMDTDIARLKEKEEAGAEFLITQLFFDNDFFTASWKRPGPRALRCPFAPASCPSPPPSRSAPPSTSPALPSRRPSRTWWPYMPTIRRTCAGRVRIMPSGRSWT